MQELGTDAVPRQWSRYAAARMTVTEWLADFARRLEQLRALHACPDFGQFALWLGGLFFPEAFLTASRQAIAQRKQVSLEELVLGVDIGGTAAAEDSFMVKGLHMEGAAWDAGAPGGGQLRSTDELSHALPGTRLRWLHRDPDGREQAAERNKWGQH